jgi:RNA polymerase sigma-70 factor (sigma-E family)
MRLQILHVPDCPGADLLETRLAPLLAGRPGLELTRQVVADQAGAERLGMTGSPTLLADGSDPFARSGQPPSVSCRLYPDEHGRPGPAPSAEQLRLALGRIVDDGPGQPITGARRVVGMRPGADRYIPNHAAGRPTSSAGPGLAEAYRVHRPGLVKLAAFIVGDQATGEDVVQDVFARLHQRWDMLADPGDPLPYLRTAVVNGCRSAIRRRGRAQRYVGHDSPSPPLSAEESVLLSEDRQQVLAALAGLSRRRREVLVLRFYVGLSEAEIAATLGISAGTVKSTAARGLAALARVLRETR